MYDVVSRKHTLYYSKCSYTLGPRVYLPLWLAIPPIIDFPMFSVRLSRIRLLNMEARLSRKYRVLPGDAENTRQREKKRKGAVTCVLCLQHHFEMVMYALGLLDQELASPESSHSMLASCHASCGADLRPTGEDPTGATSQYCPLSHYRL
ncbi:hypothetical protein P167DRAFT_338206 [Morchella conica CCBAS932]|uniref:Uncharacterized protein n=1 Tax=Morchella conica CCBAS932 TaxID=1392247 RepID=A0A3N4KDF4_9PEZI|nr:hypothetical protein P167DRAFT_338206 [Morchella conica CCBAS932]